MIKNNIHMLILKYIMGTWGLSGPISMVFGLHLNLQSVTITTGVCTLAKCTTYNLKL